MTFFPRSLLEKGIAAAETQGAVWRIESEPMGSSWSQAGPSFGPVGSEEFIIFFFFPLKRGTK